MPSLIETLYQKIDALGLFEKTQVLSRNEYLCVKGHVNTNLYYVESGSLHIFIATQQEDLTIRFGYQNDFITALDAFITEQPTDLYIQAIKETKLKMISKVAFMNFVNSQTEHLQLWHELLQGMIYQQMQRERDILTTSPVERYKRVLKRSPRLFQEIPNKYIASYLRMTPETLSRIKRDLH